MNLLKLTQVIMQKLGYDESSGTLSIEADNLRVKDNVIELNYGESTDGVSKEVSGIIINRGPNLEPATIYFSEDEQCFKSSVNEEQRSLGLSPSESTAISVIQNSVLLSSDKFDQQKADTQQYLEI